MTAGQQHSQTFHSRLESTDSSLKGEAILFPSAAENSRHKKITDSHGSTSFFFEISPECTFIVSRLFLNSHSVSGKPTDCKSSVVFPNSTDKQSWWHTQNKSSLTQFLQPKRKTELCGRHKTKGKRQPFAYAPPNHNRSHLTEYNSMIL